MQQSWHDERLKKHIGLIDWEQCWKPRFDCANRTHDGEVEIRCDVLEAESAKFMCWVAINGTVFNPMDLNSFPFDYDDIVLVMDGEWFLQLLPGLTSPGQPSSNECDEST